MIFINIYERGGNLQMANMLYSLSNEITSIFSKQYIDKIALKTKFVRRKSALDAEKFISMCVFLNNDICKDSLQDLVEKLNFHEGISISSQALDQRFNDYAVDFMKHVFNDTLRMQNKVLSSNGKLYGINFFERILITDSTSFSLPKEYREIYNGNNSPGTESLIKIQLQFDLMTGEFIENKITHGNASDAGHNFYLKSYVKAKDLHIKDLGYYETHDLKNINKKQAYYLTRCKVNTKIYIKKNGITLEEFNVYKASRGLAEGDFMELPEVYTGKNQELKSRLIIYKLTEDEKIKKIASEKKKDKKKAKTLDLENEKYSINMLLTNVPAKIIPKEIAYEMYSLRWQVEIMFKVWKSVFNVDLSKKVKIQRFQCSLYGKLMAILLGSTIVYTSKKKQI